MLQLRVNNDYNEPLTDMVAPNLESLFILPLQQEKVPEDWGLTEVLPTHMSSRHDRTENGRLLVLPSILQ